MVYTCLLHQVLGNHCTLTEQMLCQVRCHELDGGINVLLTCCLYVVSHCNELDEVFFSGHYVILLIAFWCVCLTCLVFSHGFHIHADYLYKLFRHQKLLLRSKSWRLIYLKMVGPSQNCLSSCCLLLSLFTLVNHESVMINHQCMVGLFPPTIDY